MHALPRVMPHALAPQSPAQLRRPAGVLVPCDPLDEPAWDALVAAHPDASCFHTAAWARVLHDTYGHTPAYFCRRRRDRLDQLLPVMEVNSPFTGRRGVSLPFTDECSALGTQSQDGTDLFESAVEHGRARGWKYFETRGDARFWHGATPSVAYLTHQLDLAGPSAAPLFNRLDSATRRAVRKAQAAALRVERSTDVAALRDFYRLHCRTRRRHGLPPQPWRFFANIARHVFAAGQGTVFTTFQADRPVAAAVFLHHGRQAIYKFGASDFGFQELRPNNLLMWEAIQWCAAAGFTTLHFGRTSLAQEGLRRFKLGFGAREQRLEYCRFDYAANDFVAGTDRAHGWFNSLFARLPLPLLRWLGAALYPHLA